MFLFQKFNYECVFINEQNKELLNDISDEDVQALKYCGFDTETTGLHHTTSMPFLVTFGYGKKIFAFEPTISLIQEMFKVANRFDRLFAHNAKYDYHMIWNFLGREPVELEHKIADSMTVARLTSYADEEMQIGLEILGTQYVDPEAKFASKVIKSHLIELNAEHKKVAKLAFYDEYGKKANFGEVWQKYLKRVKFVDDDNEQYQFLDKYYRPANYKDVYKSYPELMINYAMDDVVIMLEYLKQALPVMEQVDDGLTTFNRECELISAIARMEKNGIKVDVQYLLDSRKRMQDYQKRMYQRLDELAGQPVKVGQHELIKMILHDKFGVELKTCDKKALKSIKQGTDGYEFANLIVHLRTIDKWLSTYIDGKLNAIVDGRIYTDINNSGAVSGRVSCDMQQQPKEPLLDENGQELFHPRRVFVPDDGYVFIFED